VLRELRCVLLLSLVLSVSAHGQVEPSASLPSTGFPNLDRYRASRVSVYADDYGERARYREANASLKPPAPGETRVVFFGDSITDIWRLDQFFPGHPYINRGIGGQTTSQMLVRFRQDVIDLQPRVVVILAGTNDIAGNTGPISNEGIGRNFESFAELAHAHNIRVVFASILPVSHDTARSEEAFASRPMDRIVALNRWLRDYCAAHGVVYLDYFTAMLDDKGLLRRELANDGLHPNKAGYDVMTPLADKAIASALQAQR
jgi:lysophospholipase L1-like esterase